MSVIRAVDGQDTGLSAQPAEKNYISISRPASSSSTDFTIEGDISLSLADPALLSVVGVVDGQFAGFITKERMNFIYTSTERTGLGFSAFKALADRPVQRTRPLTSYPVSQ